MIGFDVGTTQSKVSAVDARAEPFAIVNDRGQTQTPSVLYYSPAGEVLIGTDAVEQGYVDPQRCVKNFKLDLGSPKPLVDDAVTAKDAAVDLIGYLKRCTEKATGNAVEECVATCPANFRDDKKQALLEAFETNKINVMKLIPEPTAAGMAYALNKGAENLTGLVYDLGGGTFDVSVIKIKGPQITVLATEGIAKLGGNDFTDVIKCIILDEIEKGFKERPDRATDPLLLQEIDTKAESAKISLGMRSSVPIVVGYKGSQVVLDITQDHYHHAINPLIHETLESMDKAVDAAKLKYNEVDCLIIVGGGSRFPLVQSMVADHTSLYPKADVDPNAVIAHGAALASLSELTSRGRKATIRGQVIPSIDSFITDVTAHSIGCCVVETSCSGKRLTNSVLIDKNTPIPCQRSDRFCLEHVDQQEAKLEILQGDPDAGRDDCLAIGEIVLDDLPPEHKRTPRIQLEYTIDENGMVTVTGTDLVSGKNKTVSVDHKIGIKTQDKPQSV